MLLKGSSMDDSAVMRLVCGMIQQAIDDLNHGDPLIRRTARDFINGSGFDLLAIHIGIDPVAARYSLRQRGRLHD